MMRDLRSSRVRIGLASARGHRRAPHRHRLGCLWRAEIAAPADDIVLRVRRMTPTEPPVPHRLPPPTDADGGTHADAESIAESIADHHPGAHALAHRRCEPQPEPDVVAEPDRRGLSSHAAAADPFVAALQPPLRARS